MLVKRLLDNYRRIRPLFLVLIAATLILFKCVVVGGVNAQSGTLLSIAPPAASVGVGATVPVTLEVSNGTGINAFEVTIVYDPEVVVLESWTLGGYLSNLAVLVQENEPGSLHLAATQLATPPVSGNGTLLSLAFKGVNLGTSVIAIQSAKFAGSSNELVTPDLSNGTITVSASVPPTHTNTSTSSATNTATFTLTPTVTNTATVTSTPTFASTLTSIVKRTSTSTPTPYVWLTRTPIRAVVITRTGLPPTNALAILGGQTATSSAFPEAQQTTRIAGGVQGGNITPAPVGQLTPVAETDTAPSINGDTISGLVATPGKIQPALREKMNKVSSGDNLLWVLGITFLGVLSGLIVLFIRLLRKI